MTTDERLDKIIERLDSIDTRLDKHDERFAKIDARFDKIDARFDKVDARFDKVDEVIGSLSRYVMEFRAEAVHRFEVADNRLEILSATVANIDGRFPPLTKAMLEHGTFIGRIMQEQSREWDASTNLAARVATLEEKLARLINPAA